MPKMIEVTMQDSNLLLLWKHILWVLFIIAQVRTVAYLLRRWGFFYPLPTPTPPLPPKKKEKRKRKYWYFSYFYTRTYVVGAH